MHANEVCSSLTCMSTDDNLATSIGSLIGTATGMSMLFEILKFGYPDTPKLEEQ